MRMLLWNIWTGRFGADYAYTGPLILIVVAGFTRSAVNLTSFEKMNDEIQIRLKIIVQRCGIM
jgi:hypothetical protein